MKISEKLENQLLFIIVREFLSGTEPHLCRGRRAMESDRRYHILTDRQSFGSRHPAGLYLAKNPSV
jgi:hypothetical protein